MSEKETNQPQTIADVIRQLLKASMEDESFMACEYQIDNVAESLGVTTEKASDQIFGSYARNTCNRYLEDLGMSDKTIKLVRGLDHLERSAFRYDVVDSKRKSKKMAKDLDVAVKRLESAMTVAGFDNEAILLEYGVDGLAASTKAVGMYKQSLKNLIEMMK